MLEMRQLSVLGINFIMPMLGAVSTLLGKVQDDNHLPPHTCHGKLSLHGCVIELLSNHIDSNPVSGSQWNGLVIIRSSPYRFPATFKASQVWADLVHFYHSYSEAFLLLLFSGQYIFPLRFFSLKSGFLAFGVEKFWQVTRKRVLQLDCAISTWQHSLQKFFRVS